MYRLKLPKFEYLFLSHLICYDRCVCLFARNKWKHERKQHQWTKSEALQYCI